MTTKFNKLADETATVWYWTGGRNDGQWRRTWGNTTSVGLNETLTSIRVAGRVAHIGSTLIGPPEGPPSEEDFRDVGV